MYHEVHGNGRPLVLLHGALSTIETDFGKVLPTFARTRQVIAVEQQAHGHTADIDRPLSFEQMADDTAVLLRQLKIENADFFGYSLGGGIALQIARRLPDLVRKLVFAGGGQLQPRRVLPRGPRGNRELETRTPRWVTMANGLCEDRTASGTLARAARQDQGARPEVCGLAA